MEVVVIALTMAVFVGGFLLGLHCGALEIKIDRFSKHVH